jgi:hypothetical protein
LGRGPEALETTAERPPRAQQAEQRSKPHHPIVRQPMKRKHSSAVAFALCILSLLCGTAVRGAGSMEAKAESIMIPHLEVDAVTIEDVFTLLRKRSKELDPDHRGINFVFKFSPAGRKAFTERTLTLNLDNIPLYDVIRYSCMASGLRYLFEDNAVIIYDSKQAPTEMNTKAYNMAPGVIDSKRTRKRAKDIDDDDDDDDD